MSVSSAFSGFETTTPHSEKNNKLAFDSETFEAVELRVCPKMHHLCSHCYLCVACKRLIWEGHLRYGRLQLSTKALQPSVGYQNKILYLSRITQHEPPPHHLGFTPPGYRSSTLPNIHTLLPILASGAAAYNGRGTMVSPESPQANQLCHPPPPPSRNNTKKSSLAPPPRPRILNTPSVNYALPAPAAAPPPPPGDCDDFFRFLRTRFPPPPEAEAGLALAFAVPPPPPFPLKLLLFLADNGFGADAFFFKRFRGCDALVHAARAENATSTENIDERTGRQIGRYGSGTGTGSGTGREKNITPCLPRAKTKSMPVASQLKPNFGSTPTLACLLCKKSASARRMHTSASSTVSTSCQ